MNRRLPIVSGAELSNALQQRGFAVVSQKGSHREVTPGTLRPIIRQAGLTVAEFVDLL